MFATRTLDGTPFVILGQGANERLESLPDMTGRIDQEVAAADSQLADLRAEEVAAAVALDVLLKQEGETAADRSALAACRSAIAEAEATVDQLEDGSAAAAAAAARIVELHSQEAALIRTLKPAEGLAESIATARATLAAVQQRIARIEAAIHELERYRKTLNGMLDMQSAAAIHTDHQAQIAALIAPFDAALAQFADPES